MLLVYSKLFRVNMCLGGKSRYIFVVLYECSCRKNCFVVDMECGEDMRIVNRGLQYVRYVGDVLGSDSSLAGVFFFKLEDNITLSFIVLYVATIWEKVKITIY